MIIERRLKWIYFHWDDESQEFTVANLDDGGNVTGSIVLGKTYLFSTMIFMRRIIQRMWGRKKK